MKLKRCLCLLLTVLLLAMPIAAQEEENELLWTRKTALTVSAELTETVFDNGYRQVEHYISYTPGTAVLPTVTYGEHLTDTMTLSQAETLEEQSGSRMIAGVNGDYYVMATGLPLGLVIRNGELVASDAGNWAFGFLEDGSAFLGRPELKMSMTFGTGKYGLYGLNKPIESGWFFLYTNDYGKTVKHGVKTENAILIPTEGESLQIGGECRYTVESVFSASGSVEIPEGRVLLSLTSDSDSWRLGGIHSLKAGEIVTLQITSEDARWSQCRSGIGCLYRLLTDGEEEENLNQIDRTMAPRTAIGLKPDGTVLLYTVDGRQSDYSRGLTMAETARRLKELGCTEAGAMDGGGSTALRAQLPGTSDNALMSSPSLGEERKVPVFLMLTSDNNGSGTLHTISLQTTDKVLLTSAKTTITAGACDETGIPVILPSYIWSANAGSIEDGCFRAPDHACTAEIRATAQGASGTLMIPVIETPDRIELYREDTGAPVDVLVTLPDSSLELCAKSVWNSMPVTAEDSDYVWKLTGNAGSITDMGTFTASKGGTGMLSVTAGECTVRISVLVMDTVLCEDDFETVEAGGTEELTWCQSMDRERVRYGSGSMCLNYRLDGGSVSFPMDQYRTDLTDYVTFWIWCDGSGNSLYSVHDRMTLLLGSMDHVGWEQFTVETGRYGAIHELRLSGSGSGTIWLDQLVLSNTNDADTEAPIIRLETEGSGIRAVVWDRNQKNLPAENLRLTVDGLEIPFAYDAAGGELTTGWVKGEGMQHVMLYAADSSGNYSSASLMLGTENVTAFPDMEGHWASDYAVYLSRLGVINGKPAADGTVVFDPNTPVTRAEFAVMLCRWLKIDTKLYAGLDSFADQNEFPDWAADSISAVKMLGLMDGTEESSCRSFSASKPLTRIEAAVILGHTMEGGRMNADLPFRDASEIPEQALPYASQLAMMGVMQGYNNVYDPFGNLTRAQAAKILSVMT